MSLDAQQLQYGLRDVASALKALGNNDAATRMGAIENLAKEVGEGLRLIAEAINTLAVVMDDKP